MVTTISGKKISLALTFEWSSYSIITKVKKTTKYLFVKIKQKSSLNIHNEFEYIKENRF